MNEEEPEIDEVEIVTPHEITEESASQEEDDDGFSWEDEESVSSTDSRFNHLESFVSKIRNYEDPRFHGKTITPRAKGGHKPLRRKASKVISDNSASPRQTEEKTSRWILEDPADLSTLPLEQPEESKPKMIIKPKTRKKPRFPIKKAVLGLDEIAEEPQPAPQPKKPKKRRRSRKKFEPTKPKSVIEQYYGYDPLDTGEMLSKNIPSSVYSKSSKLPPTRKSKPPESTKSRPVLSRSSSFRVQTGSPVTITQYNPFHSGSGMNVISNSSSNLLAPPRVSTPDFIPNTRYDKPSSSSNLTDSLTSIPKNNNIITVQIPVAVGLNRPVSPSRPDALPPVNTKFLSTTTTEQSFSNRSHTAPASMRSDMPAFSHLPKPDSPSKQMKVKRFGASVQMSLGTSSVDNPLAHDDKQLSNFFCMYYSKPTQQQQEQVERMETDIVVSLGHLKFGNKFPVSEDSQKLMDHVRWEKM